MPRSSPAQQALDQSAMPIDSHQPVLIWRGCFYQHVPAEPAAIGVFDLEDFVGEWDVEPTHESARAIIGDRLDPGHPEHQDLMDALRAADDEYWRERREAYLEDLASERALEREL